MRNCDICKGSGLVPSKVLGVFSGKPIPNCFSKCACRGDEQEHYESARVEDWDFPCSNSFRGASFDYCGQRDPGYIKQERGEAPFIETTVRHVVVHDFAARRQVAELEQIRQHVLALEKNQHTHKKAGFVEYSQE